MYTFRQRACNGAQKQPWCISAEGTHRSLYIGIVGSRHKGAAGVIAESGKHAPPVSQLGPLFRAQKPDH
jgi:hypothetical protein